MSAHKLTRRERAVQAAMYGQQPVTRGESRAALALRLADAKYGVTRRVRAPLRPCRTCKSPYACGHR